MIIKSLQLENFRQFCGVQTIDFSTDPRKKATLVIAQNGTGKTTLLESFSWVFYGVCGLKTIINNDLANTMAPGSQKEIKGVVKLINLGKEYTVTRTAFIVKKTVKATLEDGYFSITSVDENGISKEVRGVEAKELINEIVPRDLFPYFFFKGESIERIGRDISEGKNSKNSEFVKAIRGMLGFNYYYQEIEDLKKLSKEYGEEIEKNNVDDKLKYIQEKINRAGDNVVKYKTLIEENNNNLNSYLIQRREIHDEILKSGNAAEKQKQAIELRKTIERLEQKLNTLKKEIFESFSSKGFYFLSQRLINDAIYELKKSGDADKGIAGINAGAAKSLLANHKCICGRELIEGTAPYKTIYDLIKYLYPNNLGAEISSFNSIGKIYSDRGDEYFNKMVDSRKEMSELEAEIGNKKKELLVINNEIANVPDMAKKKEREAELDDFIKECNERSGSYNTLFNQYVEAKASAEKEKSNYKVTDDRLNKLRMCDYHVSTLSYRLEEKVKRAEAQKRLELEQAINEIFSEIFNSDIKLSLSNDYGINIRSGSGGTMDEFENATSQDAIMAFSFIGGIIKLARSKTTSIKPQNITDDEEMSFDVEPYPLIMDAPSSSFDISRIENFCKIMPNIAEQVIFFIKDTDGLYVKKYLSSVIGKEYVMNKISNTETEFEEVD